MGHAIDALLVPGDDDVVLVPVPKRLLGIVYGVLAREMRSSTTTEPASDESAPYWTPDLVRQVRKDVEKYPGAATAIKLSAESPGTPIPIRKVEEVANVSANKLKGDLASLTKLLRKLVPGRKPTWPMRAEWAAGGEQIMYYRMSTDIAELWNAAE